MAPRGKKVQASCSVEIHRSATGELLRVRLELTGEVRRFPPMTSGRSRVFSRGRLVVKPEIKQRMAHAAWLYMQGLEGRVPPRFGCQPVHVLIALAQDGYIKDSHNHTKAICDWLERDIKLIDNDSQAEARALKKMDYRTEFERLDTTEIIVTRQDLARSANTSSVRALREVAWL